jgi:hypothetical protein
MAKGGSSQPVKQEITQSTLPEYARPYFEGMMQRASTALTTPYQTYDQERLAGFTGQQQQLQKDILSQQTPGQFGAATGLATAAGLGSLQAGQYAPSQFSAQQIGMPNLQQYSMGAPRDVQGGQYNTPQMRAAQTGFQPNLNYFQMQGPQQFGTAQAQQYMSPFIQQALEPQMREAMRNAQQQQLGANLGSVRQGTYGGARQALAQTERERNLGQQLGDIQARGMQSAFENAQQQFERDRAAGMTTAQQNQAAALQTQQLGTQTGMQTALANLDAASQANVQNLAAKLQTQGLNADQALRAALANQQADLTRGQADLTAALQTQQLGTQTGLAALQANQQADLDRQRMAEQSRQFGSQQGLAGLAQAGQMGQTLANIGQAQSQADQARFGLQTSTAAQQQALQQQRLDMAYQDFMRQRDYPMEQLQQYSSLLRGVPVTPSSTTSTYGQQPGIGQQLLGTGLGAASIYKTFAGA